MGISILGEVALLPGATFFWPRRSRSALSHLPVLNSWDQVFEPLEGLASVLTSLFFQISRGQKRWLYLCVACMNLIRLFES